MTELSVIDAVSTYGVIGKRNEEATFDYGLTCTVVPQIAASLLMWSMDAAAVTIHFFQISKAHFSPFLFDYNCHNSMTKSSGIESC